MENPFITIENRLAGIEVLLGKIYTKSIEEEDSYLSVKETAKFLNVSEQSVHNYIREGKIPAKKVGRPYLILKSDLLNELGEVKSLKYQRL
ncbi:helix-turn-helix domain-containing protein [Flagellimonas flava]|uniref:DNA binding domain-containing protein, excisionase family n=1 Tax=Flagellimonas flava TaxID=570519 RepID=A0A1M5IEV3_9FLAO|nr:helix-turn-helix domain-containing protein [Allomuricauda flava]SHG26343.1 DNA binding domain-containing protein, excisionase family [Allomuricauda flava]